jgi:hypothetical protein
MCVRGANALLGVAAGLTILGLGSPACVHVRPCDGISCAPACPRDSAPNAAGRCACSEGDVSLFGACVPPSVADAFCGPAAVVDSPADGAGGGCVFRSCGSDDALDLSSGACVARGPLPHAGSVACSEPALPIVEEGRPLCVSPAATCPRGTTRGTGAKTCTRPPGCPPGALPDGSSCRAIVTTGGLTGHAAGPRVDVGAWATLVLGVNGGPGSPALCQPLAQRPDILPAPAGGARTLHIALALLMPDEDVSRLHAELETRDTTGHDVAPAVQALVSASVSTLLELLRSLGGEASTAVVELEVSCALGI